nr:unnamed protein product [Callosobruchus analis]
MSGDMKRMAFVLAFRNKMPPLLFTRKKAISEESPTTFNGNSSRQKLPDSNQTNPPRQGYKEGEGNDCLHPVQAQKAPTVSYYIILVQTNREEAMLNVYFVWPNFQKISMARNRQDVWTAIDGLTRNNTCFSVVYGSFKTPQDAYMAHSADHDKQSTSTHNLEIQSK